MKNASPSCFFIPSLLDSSPLPSPHRLHPSSLVPNPPDVAPQSDDADEEEDVDAEEETNEGETEEVLNPGVPCFPPGLVRDAPPNQDSSDDSSISSDADDLSPRNQHDLSHDFLAQQNSPFLAKTVEILSQSSLLNRSPQELRRHANGRLPQHHDSRIMDLSSHVADLHLFEARQNLPDLKLDHRSSAVNWSSKGCITTLGPKNAPGSAKFRPVDGSSRENAAIGKSPMRNAAHVVSYTQKTNKVLAEMFPGRSLLESNEDNSRGNFQRHASMVYTRAPSREELARKVVDLKKATRNGRKIYRKEETTISEERKDFVRHANKKDSSLSPQKHSCDNVLEVVKLQDQVAELKRILATRESMLELCFSKKDDDQSDKVMALSRKVEELQQELAERDLRWRSATETLQIRENDIQVMQGLLRDAEEKCALLTATNASNEHELQALRFQIAALLWQLEIDIENGQKEASKEAPDFQLDLMDSDVSQMETIRKMYLAAVVVARHVASEECLTLLYLLRLQLQHILESRSLAAH